jgi:hypothetical protein
MPALSPTPCFSVTYGKEESISENLPQIGLLRVASSESFIVDDTEEHPETYECPM